MVEFISSGVWATNGGWWKISWWMSLRDLRPLGQGLVVGTWGTGGISGGEWTVVGGALEGIGGKDGSGRKVGASVMMMVGQAKCEWGGGGYMAAGCLLDHVRCPRTLSFSRRGGSVDGKACLLVLWRRKIVVGCSHIVPCPTPEGVVR